MWSVRTWLTRDVAVLARSRRARIAGWTLAAIVALAAATVYGLALWQAPGWMHATTPQDRYNARVLVISVGGAIVVATGLLYTARNYRLSRRGQVTDRFTIALERLGSSELYVRIGGVHALEHVMRDSADHHNDVIEVLTEFIRDRTPCCAQPERQVWMHPVAGSVPDLPSVPTPDIQAALTALGHRPHRPERQYIDLAGLHFTGAQLRGAILTIANLNGVDLTGARLDGADLTGATLTGANLTRVWLVGADLSRADLDGAQLTGGVNLSGARLFLAGLKGADLTGAWLFDADLTGAQLTGANLTRVKFIHADLTHTQLAGADLTGARLDGARLDDADLTGARLGADPALVPSGWIVTDSKSGELMPAPRRKFRG